MLDAAGEVQEHLAGVEDCMLAEAVWRARQSPAGRKHISSFAKARESFATAAGPEW
jgi:hypothetical protein